jgi:prephenate dehydrogenase
MTALRRVLVVGTGLIGTSIALALRDAGVTVHLADRNGANAQLAAALGAGTPATPDHPAELAVLAVPPSSVGEAAAAVLRSGGAESVTDVASVKVAAYDDAVACGVDLTRYVGGHPMAGRERSGPGAARADLFAGRPWVLTPSSLSSATTIERARELVRLCGATVVEMTAEEHDRAVALVSHSPHVVASALAGCLRGADAAALSLAGPGLLDTTRVAASDPALWTQILLANASATADVLDAVATQIDDMVTALRTAAAGRVADVLRQGVEGRRALPGKHGQRPTPFVVVPVVVKDRPGQLGLLFADAGEAQVNIEDVSIEHSPGQPVGVVELSVRPEHASTLVDALRVRGWSVHG